MIGNQIAQLSVVPLEVRPISNILSQGDAEMSIFLDADTNVLVQGITGGEGKFHTSKMKEYGTQVVAGVTPGKGGESVDGLPVYDSVKQAVGNHQIDASVIFVPSRFARDAVLEATKNSIGLVVCITEHIPVHDMLSTYHFVRGSTDSVLVGPNCPGLISPGKAKAGIMPGSVFQEGSVGIVSRSGTLTYEIASQLTSKGFGQSTVVGIGGDQIVGTNFIDVLARFDQDPQTELIVLVGEIGGTEEEKAARYVSENMSTPTVAYIAGFSAPRGKRMGHAGAIISGEEGTAEAKERVLNSQGIEVGRSPRELAELVGSKLS